MPESPLLGKRLVMVGPAVIVDIAIETELRRVGARTVAACESPEESIAIYQTANPDLVLIGVTAANLPESIDAVQAIFTDPLACIVAILYSVDIEGERKLRDAGVTAVFKKPFTAPDLIAALEETFRQFCHHGT